MKRDDSTEQIVYYFICENPGMCTYQISKRLAMTGGRVRHALSKLEKEGFVKFKFERKNPRLRKLSYPVGALSLLPRPLKKELNSFLKERKRI